MGWQLADDIVIFESKEYQDVGHAMRELDFHEPSDNNWFATMVECIDGEVTDEEIFDSSVIVID
jgi:L-rhamnose mutarotase